MKGNSKKVFSWFIAATIALGVVQGVYTQSTYAVQTIDKDYTNHVYKTHIEYVIKNSLMWMYPDGNFRPDQAITQADLVVGLANAKGLSSGTPVSNLPANHWAKVYYDRAKKDGILDNVVINPGKVLNREEASFLLVNAWKSLRQVYKLERQYYSDTAVNSGWIPERSGKFANGVHTTLYDGLGTLNRGEQARVLYILHNDMKDIQAGESIASQFHASLKVSGGNVRGQIPAVNGYDTKLIIISKTGKPIQFNKGASVMFNASHVDYMEFNVKKAGQAISLAKYDYENMSTLARKNVR
ncbi:S-layer homology domain-containing protein [Brevibacillus centrosporus]|jgi:hypothetical protein|uniref:S-layer homology domain-containing protein n=1 Tax=Brevibacillus centrosporus TaxID=54910 RepID=UPI003987C6BC